MDTKVTPDEEYEFYARAENQEPQGPPRRRRARLSAPVPVLFPPALLEAVRRAADADDRSVSAWIRRAVEHELRRSAARQVVESPNWQVSAPACAKSLFSG